jgi:hypothetical protein
MVPTHSHPVLVSNEIVTGWYSVMCVTLLWYAA